ncbi:MAG: transposase [Euryarchaeota archaeon]|nr:transposase [Euryarchaeota archaeon]
MKYQKTIIIPIHYGITKHKLDKLNRLTARIAYGIQLISALIDDDIKLDRKTIRALVADSDIVAKTGLSAGYIQQCIDKVIWSWKSYKKLHKDWQKQVASAEKRDNDKWLTKLMKREPSPPTFADQKVSCRIDVRTGRVEHNKTSKLTTLWLRLSTLVNGMRMNIPLSPSHYHLLQLKDAKLCDFELIKKGAKFYAHVSISKEVESNEVSSIGGLDQGLNHSAGIVLLPLDGSSPYEKLFVRDTEKQALLQKYDDLIAGLQAAGDWHKLRQLRHKRESIAIHFDWIMANVVANATEGALLAIGDTNFRQTQYKGNEMPKLRKRIGKWSYARQRNFITLKRMEHGDETVLKNERGTSIECSECHSKMTKRKWLANGSSYILCWLCGNKKDADINAAHNIALRCRDDWLKGGMNMEKTHASC